MKRYHEKGPRLVQEDFAHVWHGYIGLVYRRTFDSEAQAIEWMNESEGWDNRKGGGDERSTD